MDDCQILSHMLRTGQFICSYINMFRQSKLARRPEHNPPDQFDVFCMIIRYEFNSDAEGRTIWCISG